MEQPDPLALSPRRPWYYQTWFLVGAFIMGWPVVTAPFGILWPVWGILMLRSPWHNHTVLKGLGWAHLVVGAILFGIIFRRALAEGGDAIGISVMIIVPGLLMTLATQVMWARYRLENSPDAESPPPPTPVVLPPEDQPSPSMPSRPRRRAPRRLRSRSGRTPR